MFHVEHRYSRGRLNQLIGYKNGFDFFIPIPDEIAV